MSVAKFIPTIWSARLLEHLDKAHVYAALVNRDYEGKETMQEGDGICVFVDPESDPDYKIISIKEYSPMLMELEKI